MYPGFVEGESWLTRWATVSALNASLHYQTAGLSFPYSINCVISGFRFAVQMRSSLFCDVPQRRLVLIYRRFVATCKSHLQMSAVQEERCFTLKNGIDRLSLNVSNYQFTMRNIPEERISHFIISLPSSGIRNPHTSAHDINCKVRQSIL